MENKQIKGLMFVRNVGKKTILTAIIDSDESLKNETQYEFSGSIDEMGLNLRTTGLTVNVKEKARGHSIDGILQLPIWRN
jgi:hypothetical protein